MTILLYGRPALVAAFFVASGTASSTAHAGSSALAAALDAQALDAARADPRRLILQAGAFDPLTQRLDVAAVGAAADRPSSSYVIVQFDGTDLKAARKALAARGARFFGYVPNNAYYVHVNGIGLDALRAIRGVRAVTVLQPALKLAPELWQAHRLDSAARREDGRYDILVHAFPNAAPAFVERALRQAVPNVVIVERSGSAQHMPSLRVQVSADDLDALIRAATAVEGVRYVTSRQEPLYSNAGSAAAIQANSTASCEGSGAVCGPTPIWDHGITGSGQIVAVVDSGTTPDAAWFATLDKGDGPHTEVTFADNPAPIPPAIGRLHPDNKIIAYWTLPGAVDYDYLDVHGTHVSATVVGDAAGTFGALSYLPSTPQLANHELADGMAPNAQLLFQDSGGATGGPRMSNFDAILEQAYAGGARVHNNSWGSSGEGSYNSFAAAADRATRKHEDLLVVASAGNNDRGALTKSPGNAKNVLSVAALGHGGDTARASFSCVGPTTDGRMKPDIAAPGTDIVSASAVGSDATHPITTTVRPPLTLALSGTSMAAPTISGNAVLARQFFADGFYPRGEKVAADGLNPTGAMLKAVLLNGASAVALPAWPNNESGWGRAWLDGNLWFKNTLPGGDDSRRLRLFERINATGLETGEANEYVLADVAAGLELRATLTWFDVDAAAGVGSTLVNDLDLEVVAPDGSVYLGNHFADGASAVGGNANAKDTVEQVRLPAPIAGAYRFRVKAARVPGDGDEGSDRQGYALAVSGAFGLPDPTPFPAPTALNVAGNGVDGIRIGFTAAAGAGDFQLYRADGECAGAHPGDFHLVASGAAMPLVDDRTQGGYAYAYKVRGVRNDVEGEPSACLTVVSQDICTNQPSFDTQSLVVDGRHATCRVQLSWAAASSRCPAAASIRYLIERDTDPYFAAPTALASNETSLAFTDTTVVDGTPYYYRVVAVDGAGNESAPSLTAAVTPTGAGGPDPRTYLDDVDTHTYARLEPPWQVTGTAASAGTLSYHSAADGQSYPSGTCASLETPELTIPAGGSLSYQARYDLSYQWDGVVSEISTDGGATWADLPPAGGYPQFLRQTTGNACGYARTQGAFTGVSTTTQAANPNNGVTPSVFRAFASDLSAHAGQSVRIRWRLSSDDGGEFSGFWIDEIRIGDAHGGDVLFADGFEAGSGGYMCR